MKRRRYGDVSTNLVLTEKAYNVYIDTDPLSIYEREDGSYDMEGCIEARGLTAEQVNGILEDLDEE